MINNAILSHFGLNPTGDWGPLTFYTNRRGKPVAFLKAPPTKPPTARQTYQRNAFRLVGRLWQTLTNQQRATWETASRTASLSITGYNLFLYYTLTNDTAAIRTIEQQTGLTLIT